MCNTTIDKSELIDIEARASRVSALIKRSAEIWLEVATEVNDAKLKLSKAAFDLFLKKASLSLPIADKMPRIATQSMLYTDEAKRHLKKLEGWTTLYEVAKLEPNQITTLFRVLDKDADIVLSRAYIENFRRVTSISASKKTVVAEIVVSDDDLQRLDFQLFLNMQEDIRSAQRIIDRSTPAIMMIVKTKAIENLTNAFANSPTVSDNDVSDTTDETEVSTLGSVTALSLIQPQSI